MAVPLSGRLQAGWASSSASAGCGMGLSQPGLLTTLYVDCHRTGAYSMGVMHGALAAISLWPDTDLIFSDITLLSTDCKIDML